MTTIGKEWIHEWENFPSEDAWDTAGKAIRERSLDNFVRCIGGLVSGWEKVQARQRERSTSSEPEDWEFEVVRLEEEEEERERRRLVGDGEPTDALLCNAKTNVKEARNSANSTDVRSTHSPTVSPVSNLSASIPQLPLSCSTLSAECNSAPSPKSQLLTPLTHDAEAVSQALNSTTMYERNELGETAYLQPKRPSKTVTDPLTPPRELCEDQSSRQHNEEYNCFAHMKDNGSGHNNNFCTSFTAQGSGLCMKRSLDGEEEYGQRVPRYKNMLSMKRPLESMQEDAQIIPSCKKRGAIESKRKIEEVT